VHTYDDSLVPLRRLWVLVCLDTAEGAVACLWFGVRDGKGEHREVDWLTYIRGDLFKALQRNRLLVGQHLRNCCWAEVIRSWLEWPW